MLRRLSEVHDVQNDGYEAFDNWRIEKPFLGVVRRLYKRYCGEGNEIFNLMTIDQ